MQLRDAMLERSPNLSPNRIADTLYNEWKDSLLVEARQRVAFNLIEKFDAFCREHNAEYFAIAGTLEGAIAYGGFIPGNNKLEVGMLRKEFLKLKKAYEEATNPSGNEEVAQKNSKAATISDNTKDEENPEDTEDSGILYRMTCTERTDNYRVYEPADSNGLGFELITTVDDDDQMMRLQPLVIAIKTRGPPFDNGDSVVLDAEQFIRVPVSPTPRRRSNIRYLSPVKIQRLAHSMRNRKNKICVLLHDDFTLSFLITKSSSPDVSRWSWR